MHFDFLTVLQLEEERKTIKDYPMECITDILKSLLQKRSEIMGQAALALIEEKYGHLLDLQLIPLAEE